ncbi:MAG: GumC family protein [Spirochaetales bacterium]|jgi:succinoglycan biosynthesis transport protein ExoP|nr:GumC family protein [Spirochaetales bacterium]
MLNQEPEQSVHLTEYFYILAKHKWVVIISLILLVTLTMLFTFQMKPVYRATAILIIDTEQSASPLTGERIDYESYASQFLTFNTHFKLITSYTILQKVVKTLKLEERDIKEGIEVSPWKELLTQFKKNIRLLLGREEKLLTPQEKLAELTDKLKAKIEIEQVRDTRLLKVSVEDHDPLLARDIANTLAGSYITFNIDNRLKSSQNTLSWMTDQLYEMKKKLEDSEGHFLAYKQQAKLFSVQGKQKVIAQKIQEFNDAYLQARNKRLELDAKLKQLDKLSNLKGDILSVRFLINNALIDNLYSQLLELEIELSHLSNLYKSKHPKIIHANSRIDKTRRKLNEELKREIENLKAERLVLLSREKVLQKTIADFENEGLEASKKELKYTILERNLETNQNLYETLLSKIKESNITGNVSVSNRRITEEAVISHAPVKPNKKLNLILSIIFGLMTGVGIAFLWEYMDRSLRTEEDVRRYLDLPVLYIIPVAEEEVQSSKVKA